MDARTQAWLDQEDSRMKDMVRQHGWAIEYIGGGACTVPGCESCDDEVAFAYTVGLFGLDHPELLVFGLGMEEAGALLNGLATRVLAGEDIIPGQLISFDGWPQRLVAETVPNPGEIVFSANRFYQRPDEFSVPVLQITYDDAGGPRGEGNKSTQPRPGTFRA